MCAELVDQPVPALAVAECDQPFRKHLDSDRGAPVARKLLCKQCWQPVAAEEVAHVGAGTGLGQKLVLLFTKHGRSPRGGSARSDDRVRGITIIPFAIGAA